MPNTDVREALLAAARALFTERGYNQVGIREIARAAGANPAMIHYYFGDKEGLYRALLAAAFDKLLGQLDAHARQTNAGEAISSIVQLYIGMLSREPWIPRLMVREVLSDEAPFREEFVARFASRGARLLPTILRRAIDDGRLRSDLDPVLTTLSLIGMMVFPFLALPLLERALGIRVDRDFSQRFMDHTIRLFEEGARGGSR